MVIKKLGQK